MDKSARPQQPALELASVLRITDQIQAGKISSRAGAETILSALENGRSLRREATSEIAYWRLLGELDRREIELRFGVGSEKYRDWSPLGVDWVTWPVGDSAAREARVIIDFDHRYSQRGLVAELRRLWPQLSRCGVVRQTRPLTARSQAIVRTICLIASPGATWAERRRLWNSKYARTHGRYESDFLMQRDFRRAERQLTGHPYGLEQLYNPIAQIDLRDQTGIEMTTRRDAGDKATLEYLARRGRRQKARSERDKRLDACREKLDRKGK